MRPPQPSNELGKAVEKAERSINTEMGKRIWAVGAQLEAANLHVDDFLNRLEVEIARRRTTLERASFYFWLR